MLFPPPCELHIIEYASEHEVQLGTHVEGKQANEDEANGVVRLFIMNQISEAEQQVKHRQSNYFVEYLQFLHERVVERSKLQKVPRREDRQVDLHRKLEPHKVVAEHSQDAEKNTTTHKQCRVN